MEWDLSDKNFPDVEIKENHVYALSKWIEKILEMSKNYEGEWDVLIADEWPNEPYTRLIGNLQKRVDAVGSDIGFRVIAYLENGGIKCDADNRPLIKRWLEEAMKLKDTKSMLETTVQENPFEIRLTIYADENSDHISVSF